MEIIKTSIPEVFIIKPAVFKDNRGLFFESFNVGKMRTIGLNETFVQDNQSVSAKGVIRAFHFQHPPYAQGKLVRVIRGAIIDVAVDLRKSSPTYKQHVSCELTGENNLMLWVPIGFAHGFISLNEDSVVFYKTTNYFHKESEGAIRWNDPEININWGIENPILSEKDLDSPFLKDVSTSF